MADPNPKKQGVEFAGLENDGLENDGLEQQQTYVFIRKSYTAVFIILY